MYQAGDIKQSSKYDSDLLNAILFSHDWNMYKLYLSLICKLRCLERGNEKRQVCTVVVVDCGLTSHSAIFQLYSDGTDVQFPNFDLLPGTHAMGS